MKISKPIITMICLMAFSVGSLTAAGSPEPTGRKNAAKAEKTKKNASSPEENSVNDPDFAFPEMVLSYAESSLQKAAKKGAESDIIRCAIQIVIANNAISTDRMPAMAQTLDSLAQNTSPAASAILYSLEAELYSDVYRSDRYKFDNRKLPLDTFPADPQQWSGELFAKRIYQLAAKSVANADLLNGTASSVYENVLVNYTEQSSQYYPTLYSILAERAIDCLRKIDSGVLPIPFGSSLQALSPKQECYALSYEIAKQWYDYAVQSGNVAGISIALHQLNDCTAGLTPATAFDTYISAYKQYSGSPYSSDFLKYARENVSANNSEEDHDLRERQWSILIPLMTECIDKHPDSFSTPALISAINEYNRGSGNIRVSSIYSGKENVKMMVTSTKIPGDMYVCVYKVPLSDDPYLQFKLGKGKFIASKLVRATPIEKNDTCILDFGKLPTGEYIVTTAGEADGSRPNIYSSDKEPFKVTNLLINRVRDEKRGINQFQVVDPYNGKPYANIKVKFYENRKGRSKPVICSTNEFGLVSVPNTFGGNREIRFEVSQGDDVAKTDIWNGKNRRDSEVRTSGMLFTDRVLYHPGDTCNFSALVYDYNPNTLDRHPIKDMKLSAILENASYEPCDTVYIQTDVNGRAAGKFTLPKGDMSGMFSIKLQHEQRNLESSRIRVEEYKQPTFYVELDSIQNIVAGETLKVSGKVLTYSGMPVGNADVKLTINKADIWWRNTIPSTFSTDVSTDSKGKFELQLTTNRLINTDFDNQYYQVIATAVSPAGESQQSELQSFQIGEKLEIRYGGSTQFDADNPTITLNFAVYGGKGDKQPLSYTLKDLSGDTLLAGESETPNISLQTANIASGTYTITAATGSSKFSEEIILYRSDDQVPPTKKQVIWLPKENLTATTDASKVTVQVGSAYEDTYIFYTVSDETGVKHQGILQPKGGMTQVDVPAPKGRKSGVWVTFSTANSCKYYDGTVAVIPAEAREEIKVEKLSFRDKISSGGKERWTFRYTLKDKALPHLPIMATMTDKSLNAIVPFGWSTLYPPTPSNPFDINSTSYNYLYTLYYSYESGLNPDQNYLQAVDFNKYNFSLYPSYGQYRFYGSHTRAFSAPSSTRNSAMEVKEEASVESIEMVAMDYAAADAGIIEAKQMTTGATKQKATQGNDETGIVQDADTGKYRPSEMPLAWFKPNLCTDENGILEISFDAPDYNTTWQLQMFGYNPDMLCNLTTEEIVSSKPVMASTNSPRFLRTGDRVMLTSTVYNNSELQVDMSGRMEIFDPLTDKIIAFEEYPAVNVEAKGSRVLALEFSVPTEYEFIGYRVSGTVPGYTDGEQSLIAIRPSSSPVTESYPFYMAPAANVYSLKLPALDKDAQVSLQFCDNPIWECVTALPDMSYDKDASILSAANRLYGNALAAGLMKEYPQLGQAIQSWSETGDSTLVSNLEKNPELKVVALGNTPWVINARSETLRKSRLTNLLDDKLSQETIAEALNRLKTEQSEEGGWSWCPGMKPSVYITTQILWRVAMLHNMGYLPADFNETMIKKALRYCEYELYQDYIEAKKRFSTTQMLNYLYIRSFFTDIPMSVDFKSLKRKAISAIKSEWREFGIYNKGTAATLLYREKEPMLARTILESLNQYASKSEERGMWFDNLRSGFFTDNTVITTAQVLEAFSEITPKSASIDMLRQWLIIERQAQDWGTDAQLAEVVYAILTSGSDWTVESEPARIYLDEEEISAEKRDRFTGSFTIPLSADKASKATLKVEKYGAHQAWGGIVARYISPIKEVKDFSESDVTIRKRILIVDETADGTSVRPLTDASVAPGQHIRVQLTVTSERDIDYAVITDERGGCIAPAQQLSGYKWQDGVGFYREVRNDVTNFFLSRLPKGDFILEYDCYVSHEGTFSAGIATLQSLYAPTLSAHSAGIEINAANPSE